ncbi:DUF2235 domain-containing protein [Geomonas sp. Red32]|uniref:phospholipase effector Tle1 domain-containing protein n=1 Tax=Geomonas sp. Red32 TaxID=2912856 RepID=UPI00202CEE6C|nr:DUF2235 domain-containing protein [Geomonas sp. Red32]MCM0084226.1 DUF2235 domain-containing protein [Geomonas sp. Red32]
MTKTPSRIEYASNSQEAGSVCHHCQQPHSQPADNPAKIRAAIFFDGTLNNRTNTEQGQNGIIKGDSYKNDFTNIAILERHYNGTADYNYCFSQYIEGIGTEDKESDTVNGKAFGWGSTGIRGKVEKGITKVMENITHRLENSQRIEFLHLDCFGFSRGAAAARHFIHAALFREKDTLVSKLQSSGHFVGEVKIRFVGLYDTVASYGLSNHNDTFDLDLDAIRHAEYVVQLAAAEEHRQHFALTNIDSAPHGIQLFLPGCHSDIGGGYADNEDEVDHQVMVVYGKNGLSTADEAALVREREWLLASGWYHKDEIQEVDIFNRLKVTRRSISNWFHRIPLKIMAEHATEKGVIFRPALMRNYKIPSCLKEIESFILGSPMSSPDYWLNLNTDMMKRLRHDFLHFSACFEEFSGCNLPRFTNDDLVNGSREREVLNG